MNLHPMYTSFQPCGLAASIAGQIFSFGTIAEVGYVQQAAHGTADGYAK
jgi:hypothetical protein